MAIVGRLVRENMRPDTPEAIAWRVAARQAEQELRAEQERRLAGVTDAPGALEVLRWFEEARTTRIREILSATP